MTRSGRTEKQIKEAVALGRKNKELIPRVKNWCSHIKIEDVSAGMIAEIYNLPLSLRISCPHASSSFEAMNFEWNANDFIRDNCQYCKFHKEIFDPNFGREVLNNLRRIKEEKEKREKEKNEKKQALKKQVDTLFVKNKTQSEITELSILNLIQSLGKDISRKKVALQLLESSKLSPTFFDTTALDYLCLYFDDKDVGKIILQTTENILKSGKLLSTFGLERLYSTVDTKLNIDEVSALIHCTIQKDKDFNYIPIVEKIIKSISYIRDFGMPHEDRQSYPKTISLLNTILLNDSAFLIKIIEEQLKIDNKVNRVNINFLLQDLIKTNADIVSQFCIEIITSLEFEDDGYGDSPDGITCTTLCELFIVNPKLVLDSIKKQFSYLSNGARIELIFFYEILFRDELLKKEDQNTSIIIKNLFEVILEKKKSIDLKETVLSLIERISRENPILLEEYFDPIVGLFVDQVKALETFKWYMQELEKPNGEISTFNPLQGKNYAEVDLERMKIEKLIRDTHSIIQNLITNNLPNNCYKNILKIISTLESSKEGILKSKLISVLNGSIKEKFYLGEILPSLHGFLLDIDSKDVRLEAIKFVRYLIEQHDQLITQTLIDLVKTFLNDLDVAVKGQSIETYGALIRMFPNQIEQSQIDLILNDILNPYIYIQKRAARLSYKIYPFLDTNQKTILIIGILSQEEYYFKNREFDYCKELIDILLFVTKEWPESYSNIVKTQVVKYCNSNDYYTAIDFFRKLTYIRSQNEEFNSIWLQQFFIFISRYKPDYNGFDKREEMFNTVYQLPEEIVFEQLMMIKDFIIKRVDNKKFFDVVPVFGILAYFGFYDVLCDLSDYIVEKIEGNRSNQSILETNQLFHQISYFEKRISNGQIDKAYINFILNNEL